MFKMKYKISYKLLPLSDSAIRRRQGTPISAEFGVVHDTGNINSTDTNNIEWATRTLNDGFSWAHWFCDYNSITICIPCLESPEKACHVNYGVKLDNQLFGDDANDIAIGGEMCYFSNADETLESYNRFVWVWAYIGYYHKWKEKYGDIKSRLIGHYHLQPWNRTDPMNAFSYIGKTWEDFLNDVEKEYKECVGDDMDIKLIDRKIDFLGTEKTVKIKSIDNLTHLTAENLREWFDVAWDSEEEKIVIRMKGE